MIDVRSYILSKFPGSGFNSQGKLHARCPFHEDRHPSFSVTEDGLFICGSAKCGVRGNFFQLYRALEGIGWKEVYEQLKDRPKISSSLEALLGVRQIDRKKKLLFNPFPPYPFVEPIGEVPYLKERELSADLMAMFGVVHGTGGVADGVDLKNSLVFPIYDYDGTYYTFQARILRESAPSRWDHPQGSCASYLLYAGWLVDGRTKDLWVVEGASDVWRLYSHGAMAVGLFTKAATDRQINVLGKLCRNFRLTPVVCMDGDAPEANEKIYQELYVSGLNPKIVFLNEDEDPGGLGKERFQEILRNSEGKNAKSKPTFQQDDEGIEAN